MKTLGDLVDLLDEYKAEKDRLADAERSIGHGGNAATMQCKWERHLACTESLETLRETPLSVDLFI